MRGDKYTYAAVKKAQSRAVTSVRKRSRCDRNQLEKSLWIEPFFFTLGSHGDRRPGRCRKSSPRHLRGREMDLNDNQANVALTLAKADNDWKMN